LCTPVALAAIVEAISKKAVRRRDIQICTGTGRSTVFAAGTRLQERRTRRNIRLDEDKAPVSLIDRVAVLACRSMRPGCLPHRRYQGPGQDERGGETHQRREQKGIGGGATGSNRRELLFWLPPGFTLLFGSSSQESRAQGMYRRDWGEREGWKEKVKGRR
jgi:hypothetical protein